MSSPNSGDTEKSGISLVRSLVLNQTIGLLAVIGFVVALFHSTRVQALVSRTSPGAHVAEWLAAKALAARPVDALFALVMIGMMVGWTVLCQGVFARGGAVSRAEWRPGVSRRANVALYLIVSASVVEEVVFRGIVMSAASYYLGTFGGLATSAVFFGLLHFEKGCLGQLVVIGYGMILGGGLLLGSSLLACVVAHAGGNALAFYSPERLVGLGSRSED